MASENDIQIKIQAINEATKVLNDVKNDLQGLTGEVKSAATAQENMSTAVFSGVAAWDILKSSLRAIGGFLKSTIDESAQAAKGQAQLNAVLASTKGVSGETVKGINDIAKALAKVTNLDDDAIVSGENMLLTFTHIGKEVFPQATEAMVNMATAMNNGLTPDAGKLRDTAIQLGMALNDPMEGISRLTRVGVVFSDVQKKQIEGFIKGGQMAKAQQIILGELETEFGNLAKESANPMEQMKTAIGEVKQAIGDELMPTVQTLSEIIRDDANELTDWINNTEEGKEAIESITTSLVSLADSLKNITETVGPGFVWAISNITLGLSGLIDILAGAPGNMIERTMSDMADGLGFANTGITEVKANVNSLVSSQTIGSGAIGNALTQNVTKPWKEAEKSATDYNKAVNNIKAPAPYKPYVPTYKASGGGGKSKATLAAEKAKKASEAAKKAAEEHAKAVKDLKEEYLDFGKKGKLELEKLSFEHDNNVKSISKNLEDLHENMDRMSKEFTRQASADAATLAENINKASRAYGQKQQNNTSSVAGAIIAEEQKIADLKTQISKETYAQKVLDLQAQLDKEQKSYDSQAEFIKSIEGDVVEARRRAGLTDLQRSIEDFKTKQAQDAAEYQEQIAAYKKSYDEKRLIDQENYNQKQADYVKQWKEYVQQLLDETAQYKTKQKTIQEMLDEANASYKAIMDDQKKYTVETIGEEIKAYQQLASAIASVQSAQNMASLKTVTSNISLSGKRAEGGPVNAGGTYLVGENGPEIFSPSGSGMITPNNQLGGNVTYAPVFNISGGNPSEIRRIIDDYFRPLMINHKIS